MSKLCIDLCSGLGGFSQAFVDAGWEVVRVDNNPRFASVPHTTIADILTYDWSELAAKHPRVVIASPPCERFSIADSHWPKPGVGKALQIVGGVLEAIIALKPDYWLLENPKGRLRWFLGAPPHSVKLKDYGWIRGVPNSRPRKPTKPTDLWGNVLFPLLGEIKETKSQKYDPTGWGEAGRMRNALSAEMPYGLSQTILKAVSEGNPRPASNDETGVPATTSEGGGP